MLSEIDKKIVRQLQEDMPIVESPFKVLADEIGISEEEYIEKTKYLVDNGFIRRFGAALNHRKVGFSANAMVVWIVPEVKVLETGKIMASFREVSHCYQRPTFDGWPYNMFTMIHGKTRDECEIIAKNISHKTSISDFKLVYSSKEFKKSSMKYFLE